MAFIESLLTDFRAPCRVVSRLHSLFMAAGFAPYSDFEVNIFQYILGKMIDSSIKAYSEAERTQMAKHGAIFVPYGTDFYCIQDYDTSRHIEDMTLDDFVLLNTCLKMSQRGHYLLMHYDSLVMANPYLPDNANWFRIYDNILAQCRSVILDITTPDNPEIASLPFYKFFNMNEISEYALANISTRIDSASMIEFTEKMDGSFMQLTATGDADEPLLISSSGSLYVDVADQLKKAEKWIQNQSNFTALCVENPEYTFMFEWIDSISDPHVVDYSEYTQGLYLIGARNKLTGELLYYNALHDIADKYDLMITELNHLTLSELLQSLKQFKASDREGVVLHVDKLLVKIKFEDYLQVARVLAHLDSYPVLVERILADTLDDMYSTLSPTVLPRVQAVVNMLIAYREDVTRILSSFVALIPDDNRGMQMKWVEKNVPKDLQGGVRALLLGKEPEILGKHLQTKCPHYLHKSELEQNMAKFERWYAVLDELKG